MKNRNSSEFGDWRARAKIITSYGYSASVFWKWGLVPSVIFVQNLMNLSFFQSGVKQNLESYIPDRIFINAFNRWLSHCLILGYKVLPGQCDTTQRATMASFYR